MKQLFALHPELSSFIVDAEIVAVDIKTGGLKSFQELSQRARKDVRLEDVTVAVCLFVYDLMYLDGKVSNATAVLSLVNKFTPDIIRNALPSAKEPPS
jgi:ATP-dependent DNA ligase